MSNEDCPFCEAAGGLAVIFRGDEWHAIYNSSPVVPGHSLLIPIRHVEDAAELSDTEQREFFMMLSSLVAAMLPAYGAQGYDLALQSGHAAGQSIGHLHFHVLPRKDKDLPDGSSWTSELGIGQPLDDGPRKRLDLPRMQDEARRIARYLPGPPP
ncbi:HIT family protein [Micromonospora sp. NPDC004704]